MTQPALIERITRSLAYMLRHQPEKFDLELDAYGYADVDQVVRALNERLGEQVELADLESAITSGDRPRYEIRAGRVRALYGHSIDVQPGEPSQPPELLHVGIAARDAQRALQYGLRGGRRRFLHLALTPEDAMEAGRRAGREYAILTVFALDAWEEGINFYDRQALYLAEEIPTEFLEIAETRDDGFERPQFNGRDDEPRRERAAPHGGGRERRGHFHDHPRGPARTEAVETHREPAEARPDFAGAGDREQGSDRRGRRGRRGGRGRHAGVESHGGPPREREPLAQEATPRDAGRGEFAGAREFERPARSEAPAAPRRERHGHEGSAWRSDREPARTPDDAPIPAPRGAPNRTSERAPAVPSRPEPARETTREERGGFGLGVFEEPETRRAPPAPPPRRETPPPAPRERRQSDDGGPGFGAGV